MKKYIFLFSLFLLVEFGYGQNIAINNWATHLNYTNINSIIKAENTIYVGTKAGLFSYSTDDNSLVSFSKLDGISSMNVSALNYSPYNGALIIGYADGNIDLLLNGKIINIPYINTANILASKYINHIYIDNDVAYISCPFGLVKLDIINQEILETYQFFNNNAPLEVFQAYVFDGDINSAADSFLANKIFVGTSGGVFYADKNTNLLDYTVWFNDSRISLSQENNSFISDIKNHPVLQVIGSDLKENGGKRLIIGTEIDYSTISTPWFGKTEYNLFEFNTLAYLEPLSTSLNLFTINTNVPGNIIDIQYDPITNNNMIITNDNETEKIILLKTCGSDCAEPNWLISKLSVNTENIENSPFNLSFSCGIIHQNQLFLGDLKSGLMLVNYDDFNIYFLEKIAPNGPVGINIGSIASSNNQIILTHGAKNGSWNNTYNLQEVSFFKQGKWTNSQSLINNNIYDAIACSNGINNTTKNNLNHFFVGTWNNGLLEFMGDSLINNYNAQNTNNILGSIIGTDNWSRVGGIDVDMNNNIWLTNSQTEQPLVKISDNNWFAFNVPGITTNTMSGKILCTTNDQKWIQLRNEGVIVAKELKNTIISKKIGVNNGLPSQTVNCFSEDKDGAIWIGTTQGLAVFYFPDEIFNNTSYSADYILVETDDGYVEKLFENTDIQDIYVDGGNRKWIATKSNGVFLISADGTTQIYNFTKENSPLLSNSVYEISIIPSSGEVFFVTEQGVCSYRSNSSDSKYPFNNVTVFPNPVRRNYEGVIAINGLSDNTNVKVTDISGNLVFETFSIGGTATWDGKNYENKKVATGVYLFLCTDEAFQQNIIKKVLIYN